MRELGIYLSAWCVVLLQIFQSLLCGFNSTSHLRGCKLLNVITLEVLILNNAEKLLVCDYFYTTTSFFNPILIFLYFQSTGPEVGYCTRGWLYLLNDYNMQCLDSTFDCNKLKWLTIWNSALSHKQSFSKNLLLGLLDIILVIHFTVVIKIIYKKYYA